MRSAKAHAGAKAFKKERKRIGTLKGTKPERDPKYLEYIRSLPCVICWVIQWRLRGNVYTADIEGVYVRCRMYPVKQALLTEAAHTGLRGLGQKASDLGAIPLCTHHHRSGPEAHHLMGKKFWGHWAINRLRIVNELNIAYRGAS